MQCYYVKLAHLLASDLRKRAIKGLISDSLTPEHHIDFHTMSGVLGLGQASDWDPHGTELAVAAGLNILGWLLAITVIAAITRLFSRS